MPQWKVWFLTFVVCWGTVISVSGQSTPNWERYNEASIGVDLQSSSSLSYSPVGNLWVSHVGQGVVSKFNGYEVSSLEAPTEGVFRVYESESRQLWALHPMGLQSFDGTAWERHVVGKIRAEIRSMAVRSVRQIPLLPAERNNVLVLLSDQLIKYDSMLDQSVTLLDRSSLDLGSFNDLIPSADAGIWIAADSGIVRIPTLLPEIDSLSEHQVYRIPQELNVYQLRDPFEIQDGLMMMGIEIASSKKVLVRFEDGLWSKIELPELPNKKIRRCWLTSDGHYWGLCVDALYQWTERNPEPERVAVDPDSFSDVAMDASGAFFISGPGGVWRYSPFAWRPPVEFVGDSHEVGDFAETPDNGLWFVDGRQLVNSHDGNWQFHPINEPDWSEELPPADVGVLPSGKIVVVRGGIVLVYDVDSGSMLSVGSPGKSQTKLLGRVGPLLLFTDSDKGWFALGETGWVPVGIAPPDGEIGDWTKLIQSTDGDYWMGGTRGVSRYSDGVWTAFPVSDGALTIAELGEETIWIGGYSNVQIRSGQEFWELNALEKDRSGRPILDRVNTILLGEDGGKWVAAANGLWREVGSRWLRFGSDDGLPRNLLTYHQTAGGEQWVGSEQGVFRFFPDVDRDPPQTILDDTPQSRQVSPQDMISFSFSGRDKWHANQGDRLLYSWRFDDEEWSGFSKQRRVSRNGTSFSEGEHRFEVRSMDIFLNVDRNPATARFDVVVPWFLEPRLRAIIAIAAIAVLVFAGLAVNRHVRLKRSYAEIEKIVDERTHQLRLANQELAHSEKMRSLGTLAAGVAHDFNSILSIIRGSVQIIEANPENHEKVRTRVDRIKKVVEQGSTLVKSMLGFSRADDAGLALDHVDEVVEGAVQLLGDRLPEGIDVGVNAVSDLPSVHGNRELLQQIIVNLVLNAVDAMEGKGSLTLRCQMAHRLPENWVLHPGKASEYVAVTVEDNGCGISADNLSRIFEPFFTTKAFSTRHGTGLGLSMVYEFCRELGYGLSVKSEQNRGTSFSIVIPVIEHS